MCRLLLRVSWAADDEDRRACLQPAASAFGVTPHFESIAPAGSALLSSVKYYSSRDRMNGGFKHNIVHRPCLQSSISASPQAPRAREP